ncbi:hypothetical protein [Lacticaseibacillus camelliae]|uniref:Uncharacterized protein n=1 Tax=Lacticaseibacillus camelliae DSM 22697 = JCM 13995 TaxID=1423730 RepID=A0A0R2EYY7_9LACO|nr:hypothetical protein [Lacticaseibacillus camelliae]KRN21545.1 hypothetical protein FC75_GL002177 [Lacticaseibacillus camelliae DSM 22697 = JCM 13995]
MTGPSELPAAAAAWLQYCRAHNIGLFDALTQGHAMPKVALDEDTAADVALYFFDAAHDEDFARAWLASVDQAGQPLGE